MGIQEQKQGVVLISRLFWASWPRALLSQSENTLRHTSHLCTTKTPLLCHIQLISEDLNSLLKTELKLKCNYLKMHLCIIETHANIWKLAKVWATFWWRRIKVSRTMDDFNSQQTPQKTILKRKEATLLRSRPPFLRFPPNPAGTWCSVWRRAASPLCSAVYPWSHWAGGREVWRIPGLRISRVGVPARCVSG